MPGRIMMEPGASGSVDLKKDKSHAQAESRGDPSVDSTSYGSRDTPASDHPQHKANGNGLPTTNGSMPLTNGDHAVSPSDVANMASPPPLDQSWRTTDVNKSMGKLMDRVAQRCYLDLQATLSEMSKISAPAGASAQANGVSPGAVQLDESEVSKSKKRKLLEFANDQRDRFTKTLVLADWTKNADEMARIIDINVWQRKQDLGSKAAAFELADIKHSLTHLKMPAPNIEGAMELLATGRADWVPDPGYIAPERLTSKQLLKTLRDMNVALATRLNLDEELPPDMSDFTIANGRATFQVPGEFEVDLTIADEDPSTPFYFIDIRFLFTPCSDLLPEIVRPRLEASVNIELANKGLKGCYDFLHNFVLTHKINVLRAQAGDMIRNGKWFDCIKVELLRRTLTVSYWNGVLGQKSWIVVAVVSGRQAKTPRRKLQPRLRVQWYCDGLAQDEQETADFQLVDLDLERCIMSVISKHSFRKLESAKAGIEALTPSPRALTAEILSAQSDGSRIPALELSLPGMRKPLNIRIEPVTGQYSISPVNATTLFWQTRLNHVQNVQVPQELASMAAKSMQVKVNDQAQSCGWSKFNAILDSVELPPGTYHRSHFKLKDWNSGWGLTATFGTGGEQWSICRVQHRPATAPNGPSVNAIVTLQEVIGHGAVARTLAETSESSLKRIERLAVAEIFHWTLASEFEMGHIPYKMAGRGAPADHGSPEIGPSAIIFTKFSRLVGIAPNAASKPWASEVVRLAFFGIDRKKKTDDGDAYVKLVLKLTLNQGKLPELRQMLSTSSDQDIRVNSTGGLALRFWSPFGAPLVEQIRIRLKNLEKLDRHLATLKQCGFTHQRASLNSIVIRYGAADEYTAALRFAEDGSLPVLLELMPDSNPHHRIGTLLERSLNNKAPSAFSSFVASLQLTLPLLQTIDRLEESHGGLKFFTLNARAPTVFIITYGMLRPACKFELIARSKWREGKSEVRWLLQEAKSQTQPIAEVLATALKELWKSGDSRWTALGNSIVAPADTIAAALEKLDEVVRKTESSSQPEQQQTDDAPAAHDPASGQAPASTKSNGGNRPAQPGQQPKKSQHNEVIELD
ncbi:Mediator complex subunit MED14 [Teratosphaeria destructans]|uniref:Mediator of RNA polymerase II transcription subunit 14 n=1 Tax=Teratosphaeria destructans TaxID=418781 RepID=A0A9W7W121_9PEZI|nr:Mediator complex subunit MED14 [Teratosphaeria destructans]